MRRIVTVRTLALSTALILALGGIGCASAEETSDTGELPSDEASEDAADETISPAEKPDTEASGAKEE
jgi:hypothetical protein